MDGTSNKLQGAVWVQSALRDQCTGLEIPMKFTAFGIQVGEDAETLKQLGVPALVAQIDEDMTYYWQVETEDGGCCLCVKATDHIITSMEIMIF